MAGYIDAQIVTNPDDLSGAALDYLIANIPGYVPREGHLDVRMLEAIGRMAAVTATVATSVPTSIFRFYGRSLIGLPPIDAARAGVHTTWTMVDTQGYTIRAGTVAAFRVAGDELIPFTVDEDIVVPAGDLATSAGAVAMTAVDPGSVANDLPVGPMVLVDALAYVDTVASVELTGGGVDAEDDATYLDRLAAELALLAPRPILPDDFAVMARRIAGVHRALALDGYDPGTATFGNERMISVALVDEDGNAVSVAEANAVQAFLDSEREVNFVVHTINPSYTVVNVIFTATALPGYVAADVQARAVTAVSNYLDPAVWAGGGESPPVWRADTKVRYLEVATVLNNVVGLDHITTLTINGSSADLTLTGVAPLPQVGTITGTVV